VALEQHLDERFQPFSTWMIDASLPVLHCAPLSGPGGQVALAQTRPPAVAE